MKKLTLVLPTLALALSLTLSPQSFASFTDVPASHPNYEAIDYVQSEGIVEGYPDGTYGADLKINRAEFTKIITEAVFTDEEINACNTSIFKDVPVNEWFAKYVCIAEKNNIIDGYPDGTFQPANDIKIVEAAKIIVNGFKYPVQEDTVTWYKPYILKLEELKALPTSLTGFEHLMKRGEMAEVIHRLHAKVTNKPSTTYASLELVTVGEKASANEISNKAAIYANTILQTTDTANVIYAKYKDLLESVINNPTEENLNKLEVNRQSTITVMKDVELELQNALPFLNDENLKNAYINAVKTAIQLMENEYKELNELLLKGINDEINQEDEVRLEELSNAIDQTIGENIQKTDTALKAFASKFDFNIVTGGSADLNAYNYLNNILIYQSKVTAPLNDYNTLEDNTSPPGDYEMLDKKRIEAINEIKKMGEEISLIEGYQSDFSLRDALLGFIKVGLDVLENEHKQLIDLRIKMNNEELTQENLDKVSQLYASGNEKLSNGNETFNAAIKSFSEKYGLTSN